MSASTRPGLTETAAAVLLMVVSLAVAACSTDQPADQGFSSIPVPSPVSTTLAGSSFHISGGWGYTHNGFVAAVAGNDVVLSVEESGEPAVVEQISPNTYVAYTATARTSTTPGASTISAPLDGSIEFCALRSPMSGAYACRVEDRADPTPAGRSPTDGARRAITESS